MLVGVLAARPGRLPSGGIRVKWSTKKALEWSARKQAVSEAGVCPNCGAPPNVEMINVSTFTEAAFVPGEVDCSIRCWLKDPDAYIAAVNA